MSNAKGGKVEHCSRIKEEREDKERTKCAKFKGFGGAF